MGSWRNTADRYDHGTIALHWLGAIAILAMLTTAIAASNQDNPMQAVAWMKLHAALGVTVSLVLLARVAWHFANVQPRKLGRSPTLNKVATAVHATLLVLIVAQLATGPLDVWSGGWAIDVFGLVAIPSPFGPTEQPWHEAIGQVHRATGYGILSLVALHLAAAAKHGVIDRDGTVQRMLGLDRR